MICQLTIGPDQWVLDPSGDYPTVEAFSPRPRDCIGSRCSAHVRQDGGKVACGLVPDGETWPDPAAEKARSKA